jgi:hypothetical protein
MKALLFSLFMTTAAFAQDSTAYLKNFESKVYSLKTKGVKNFMVDIESSKLTKQMRDQQTFGKIDHLVFRTYWTAEPERIAIEIIGLPEGFKEIKEELKGSLTGVLDALIPPTFQQRFPGYKATSGKGKEIVMQDSTGLAPIPSYNLAFDEQDRLTQVVGNRPIGTLVIKPTYEKESFAEGKWVLTEQSTTTTENGQTLTVTREMDYGKIQGMSVLTEMDIVTEQKSSDNKKSESKESVEFKNYKINDGEVLKYFLGETKEK